MMTKKKLIVALIGAIVYALYTGLADNNFSPVEIIGLVAMVCTVIGTWIVPNTTVLETAKTWLAALVIGAGILASAIADGWQFNLDFWPVVIGVLTAAGVYIAPGAPLHEVVSVRRTVRP
jgi:hypothetical protein